LPFAAVTSSSPRARSWAQGALALPRGISATGTRYTQYK
jgi:hypothetical protein